MDMGWTYSKSERQQKDWAVHRIATREWEGEGEGEGGGWVEGGGGGGGEGEGD